MRVGVVASSSGWTFREVLKATSGQGLEFVVVTDRACGMEDICAEHAVPCERIEDPDRASFSARVGQMLVAADVDFSVLLFNRLVSSELYGRVATLNIHSSMLPAFKGFLSVEQAHTARVRFLGATLHLATEEPDGGPIVAQACAPVDPDWALETYMHMAFIQRVYLFLLAIDLRSRAALQLDAAAGTAGLVEGLSQTDRCNPAIEDEHLLAAVEALETEHGMRVTTQGPV